MARYERVKARVGTQLMVNGIRLERRLGRLGTDDVLGLYEEGSNLYFSGDTLERRAIGAQLLDASVKVLQDRYDQIRDLDLSQPFPLREWISGIPADDRKDTQST